MLLLGETSGVWYRSAAFQITWDNCYLLLNFGWISFIMERHPIFLKPGIPIMSWVTEIFEEKKKLHRGHQQTSYGKFTSMQQREPQGKLCTGAHCFSHHDVNNWALWDFPAYLNPINLPHPRGSTLLNSLPRVSVLSMMFGNGMITPWRNKVKENLHNGQIWAAFM